MNPSLKLHASYNTTRAHAWTPNISIYNIFIQPDAGKIKRQKIKGSNIYFIIYKDDTYNYSSIGNPGARASNPG